MLSFVKTFERNKLKIIFKNSHVYIRWITAARALDFESIDLIPTDNTSVSKGTSIFSLKQLAKERIFNSLSSNEAHLLADIKVQLFFASCPIRTSDEKDIRLRDIIADTKTSFESPLNIYVVPTSSGSSDVESPETLWAFESTKRGIATFQTCLKCAISQARSSPSDRPRRLMLKTFFRVLHFPPALTALHTLLEENKLEPYAVVVLATCFRELAIRMVPGFFIGNSLKAVLEGSRQIFAWLDHLNTTYNTSAGEADDPETTLVRTVEFKEITDDQVLNEYRPGKRCDIVEFDASGDPMYSETSSTPRKSRRVKVWTAANCQEDVKLLALAMWGYYDHSVDFYVDFRDNINNPCGEKRTPLVPQGEFSRLINEANTHPQFRMRGPKSLENLPTGITLSKEGFVSIYDTNEGHFKDLRPTTWNAISGTEMLGTDFMQTLETALRPIVKERTMQGSWALDDWQDMALQLPVDKNPQEAIVICFDLSCSMIEKLGYAWIGAPNSFSKLDETKQVFENVILRMRGYHILANFIGVVTFSTKQKVKIVKELTQLSQLPSTFCKIMENENCQGCTALWDGIDKAKEMLIDFKRKNPLSKLRIIALTDGKDNDSVKGPAPLCQELYDANIVLDSLVVGSRKTQDLFKMSKHTGGYAFVPSSRVLLYQTFLLEPFLDITARPDIERVPIADYSTSTPKEADMKTTFEFPPCRPQLLETGSFVALSDCGKFFISGSRPPNSRPKSMISALMSSRLIGPAGGDLQLARVARPVSVDALSIGSDRSTTSSGRIMMREIDYMLTSENHGTSNFDTYVNESNMSFWKVVMSGPVGSPYEKGNFVLSVSLTETFPQTPPLVRFLTPVLHPNITKVS
jgi:hypothetical protein